MLDARESSAARLREAAVAERRAAQRYQQDGAPRESWQPYIDRATAWESGAQLLEAGMQPAVPAKTTRSKKKA